jgi:hypothetical protein
MNSADLVPLQTAADWFPHKGGQRPSDKSLVRCVEMGRNGVRLRASKIGGQWFTCREWVEAFLNCDGPANQA